MMEETTKAIRALSILVFSGALFIQAATAFLSYAILLFNQDERWFSRLFLCLMCVGFLYIGQEIGSLKESGEKQ